jgi:hypothetical protein
MGEDERLKIFNPCTDFRLVITLAARGSVKAAMDSEPGPHLDILIMSR